MTPVRKFFTNALERVFFRPAIVSEAKNLSGHFRFIELSGESLKGETWIPGQKVQFHLGNLVTRTYTPTAWNQADGFVRFIMFLHGNGPGSEWAGTLRRGDICQFMGPRDSLNLAESKHPTVFFGDETSIGAAHALHSSSGSPQNHYVFEVSSLIESEEVLECVGVKNAKLVQRAQGDAHLPEVEWLLSNTASYLGKPHWIFTGKAQSIQGLRKLLRSRRQLFSSLRSKAYWAAGKTGLD